LASGGDEGPSSSKMDTQILDAVLCLIDVPIAVDTAKLTEEKVYVCAVNDSGSIDIQDHILPDIVPQKLSP